jgi:hypothetical protein
LRTPLTVKRTLVGLCIPLLVACEAGDDAGPPAAPDQAPAAAASAGAAFDSAWARLAAGADAVDDLLQPLPLLTPGQIAGLRSHGNAAQVARARALGVHVADSAAAARLRAEGRLLALEDSTAGWVVRELEHSLALLTPDALELLRQVTVRFQERLGELGLPPYRVEVTSVLRTPQIQSDLRTTNPNAAAGASSHEFGTTFDLAYNAFAPPARSGPPDGVRAPDLLAARLGRIDDLLLEVVAARRSRELQAILGEALLELQREGSVMVTLEQQQPVFHMTVAAPLAR